MGVDNFAACGLSGVGMRIHTAAMAEPTVRGTTPQRMDVIRDAHQLGEERYCQANRERNVLERDFEGDRPTVPGHKVRNTRKPPAQQDGNGESDENRGQRDAGEAAEDAYVAQEQYRQKTKANIRPATRVTQCRISSAATRFLTRMNMPAATEIINMKSG